MPYDLTPAALHKLLETFQVPGYQIRLVRPSDTNAISGAARTVTNAFLDGEPLTVALSKHARYGKNIQHLDEYWSILCQKSAEQGLLMIAEAPDGTIGAAAVGVRYGTPIPHSKMNDPESPVPPFYDILTELDPALEASISAYNTTASSPAQTLELYANGALPNHRGSGLTMMMDAALAAIGLLQGFTHVTVKLTHEWQKTWLAYGIPFVQEIDYKAYEWKGDHPFAVIEAPKGVRSLWVEIAVLQILVRPRSRLTCAEPAAKAQCEQGDVEDFGGQGRM